MPFAALLVTAARYVLDGAVCLYDFEVKGCSRGEAHDADFVQARFCEAIRDVGAYICGAPLDRHAAISL